MVQRKASTRLGLLNDHVKSEGMANVKPNFQHQECKNKAADLKIIMKKSRSIKSPEIKSPRSLATKRMSLPGKPPPSNVQSVIVTPHKQFLNKSMEWSPNYMKSTSSADARRKTSLMSSRNSYPVSVSKPFNKRDSNSSKVSSMASKLAKTETKSSNIKLVRSLAKTRSFMNARSTTKECSRTAISADMVVQKATCSSIMKNSKFPNYLVLNPGGTESERTSVEKVCRYTYCSLNGHHQSHVPPLKMFLSTRRRSLKTQRSFRVEGLSPRRAKKPVPDESKKVENRPLCKEEFSCSTSPLMQKQEMDYFIEIFSNIKEDESGNDEDSRDANNAGNFSFPVEPVDFKNVPYWGSDVKQVAESLSDGPPCSEIDFEENHGQYDVNIPAEGKTAKNYTDAEKDFEFNLVQELEPEKLIYGVISERENHEIIESADTSSEATDMDWEDVHMFSEADYHIKVSKFHSELDAYDKSEIKQNNTEVSSHDEIQCDEIVEYSSEGESGCSDEQFDSHYPEWDVNNQDAAAKSFAVGQGSPDEETCGGLVITGENDTLAESAGTVSIMALTEDPKVEGMAEYLFGESTIPEPDYFKIGSQQGDNQIELTSEKMVEAPYNLEENNETSDAIMMPTKEDAEIDENGGEKSNLDKEDVNFSLVHQAAENGQVADADQSDGEVNKTVDPSKIIDRTEKSAQAGDDTQIKSTGPEICIEKIKGKSPKSTISSSIRSQELDDLEFNVLSSFEDHANEVVKMEAGEDTKIDSSDITPAADLMVGIKFGHTNLHSGVNSYENFLNSCNNLKWIIQRKFATEDCEELRQFNPREPNYLPLVPDPEAEKVNLQHQDMDERKNSEEWMLDRALQKTVNKLAPARKRKVELLVEAFETVATKQE